MSQPPPRKNNRRRSQRRPPRSRAKVVCQKGSLWLGVNLTLSVLDMSQDGVRLAIKAALLPGQEVSLSLEGPVLQRKILRVGTVMWSLPLADGAHAVGIALQKHLEYTDFLQLT
jgi:hypothetical protein